MKTYKSNIPRFSLKKEPSNFKKVKINSSLEAKKVIKAFYSDDISVYESFFILLLNSAHNTVGWVKIGQGGIVGTTVDIQILAKYVIDSLAKAVIIAHNHPSGNMEPSNNDILMTKRIKEALKLFNVALLDHIILSGEDDNYYSFVEEGLLNN